MGAENLAADLLNTITNMGSSGLNVRKGAKQEAISNTAKPTALNIEDSVIVSLSNKTMLAGLEDIAGRIWNISAVRTLVSIVTPVIYGWLLMLKSLNRQNTELSGKALVPDDGKGFIF